MTSTQRYYNTIKNNAWRWITKKTQNPTHLLISLAYPLIFFALFHQILGSVAQPTMTNQSYASFLLPAIIIQATMAAAASSGIGYIEDIKNGVHEKILVSPMPQTAVYTGKTLAELIYITTQTIIILLVATMLNIIPASPLTVLAMIFTGIIFSTWYTAYTYLIAITTQDYQATQFYATAPQLPLWFLSPAFLPLQTLPGWIQTIAMANPVTYGINAIRSLLVPNSNIAPIEGFTPNIVILTAFSTLIILTTLTLSNQH